MATFFLAVGVALLVGALFLGKFTFSIGDDSLSDKGWPVTRRDNPRAYWIGIAAMVVWVAAFGFIVAVNHGVNFVSPNFKL